MEMLTFRHRLRGILNGIDVEVHNPATDPDLPYHFSADDLNGKAKCRAALAERVGLQASDDQPICGVVSRLSNQKGFDLIINVSDRILATGARLVVLGTGDPWAANELRRLQDSRPGQVAFIEAFDAPLAQLIYGGSDIFLMPSAFEPCGLGQMFAMHYGTVPVIRRTGGLADTVFDGVNGFTFDNINDGELAWSVERAVAAFQDKEAWHKLVLSGMTIDVSWKRSAVEYDGMYETAIRNRLAELAAQA